MTAHTIFNRRQVVIERSIGANFMAARREDHANFYCPNGHPNVYDDDNKAERLAKELEAARSLARRESRRREEAQAEARTNDYRARYAKGLLTKERRRIANGVCPCCNRSFTALQAHIRTQHPDYVVPAEAP